jgi:hypothetical protein
LKGLKRLPKNLVFSSHLHSFLGFPGSCTQRVEILTNSASGFLSGLTNSTTRAEREREKERAHFPAADSSPKLNTKNSASEDASSGALRNAYGTEEKTFHLLRNFRFLVSNFLPAFFSIGGSCSSLAEVAIILRKDSRLAKFGYKQDMEVNFLKSIFHIFAYKC